MLLSYFFLQNAWYFTDRGDTLQQAASVSLSPNEVHEIKDKSIQEIVAKIVQSQVFNALKNFEETNTTAQ